MSGPNATVWSGDNGEFTPGTAQTLADASSVDFVDASGVFLADVGVTFTAIPPTTWSEADTA